MTKPDPQDDRIPVRLVTSAGPWTAGEYRIADEDARIAPPEDARLVSFRPPHAGGCPCCGGRAPFVSLLTGLFGERARGEVVFFGTLVAISDPSGLQVARTLLVTEPILAGRYREAVIRRPGHPDPAGAA